MPKYLSKQNTVERSTSATSKARQRIENFNVQKSNKQTLLEDHFHDLNILKCKLDTATLPSDFLKVISEILVKFHYIASADDINMPPKLMASVVIRDTLNINVYVASVLISQTMFQHLLSSNIVWSAVEVCNVPVFCRSLCHPSALQTSDEKKRSVQLVITALSQYIIA